MKLSTTEISEIQQRYRYLTNYESTDLTARIDPLSYVDSNGDGLLHIAAQRGDLRTIELLLKGGADVNQLGDMGNTALHYADTQDIADTLMAHGALTDVINEFGKRPLEK